MREIPVSKNLSNRLSRIFFVLWSDLRALGRSYLKLYRSNRDAIKNLDHTFTTNGVTRLINFIYSNRDRSKPMALEEFFNRRLALMFRDLMRNLYYFNEYVKSLPEDSRSGDVSDFVSLYEKVRQSLLSVYTLLRRGIMQLNNQDKEQRAINNKFKVRILNNDPFQLFLSNWSIEKYLMYLKLLREISNDVKAQL